MLNSKKDLERKKKEVLEKLKKGELTTTAEPSSSSHGSFWEQLLRIKCSNDEYEPFVQCRLCHEILSYSISNGTSTISYHVKKCLDKSNKVKNNKTLDSYLSKSTGVNAATDDKRSITVACAKLCAFDMRPFNIVKGVGFSSLCQSLINLGYEYGTAKLGTPSARLLLPDPTNVSRTVSQIAHEYRNNLKNILKDDLKNVKLIGLSTDYWKNTGTNESYLTINIHYSKNEQIVTHMLETSLFDQSKTGENTRKRIFSVLLSYDIDPDIFHIVYVTDNGSNLVFGLRKCLIYIIPCYMILLFYLEGEVHLRYVCHCINLALHNAVDLCPSMQSVIKSYQHLCTHFKRCEMNPLLPTSLKLNVDTRWNSVYDMFESISLNFQKCEDLLLNRNEIYYMDDISRKSLVPLVNFLSLFRAASEQLSADTTPTLHLVVPWFWKLKNACEINDDDHLLLVQFKHAVSKMLDEKIHLTSLHYIATFLYPVTKKFSVRRSLALHLAFILKFLF
jgi:hypothetical protein